MKRKISFFLIDGHVGGDREAERTMCCFCVTSQATYWTKSFPPLLPSRYYWIFQSRKIKCFVQDLLLSIGSVLPFPDVRQFHAFMDTNCMRWTLKVQSAWKRAAEHYFPRNAEQKKTISIFGSDSHVCLNTRFVLNTTWNWNMFLVYRQWSL